MRVHGDVVSEWDHAGVVRACTTAGSACSRVPGALRSTHGYPAHYAVLTGTWRTTQYSRVPGALRSTHVLSGTAWRGGAGAVTMLRGRSGGYRGAVFCGQRRHGGRLERCALRERSRPHVRYDAAWDTMLYGIPCRVGCHAPPVPHGRPCKAPAGDNSARVCAPHVSDASDACTGALSRKACVWQKHACAVPWPSVRTHSRVHRVDRSLWSASVRVGSRWRV